MLWVSRHHLLPEAYIYGLADTKISAASLPSYLFGHLTHRASRWYSGSLRHQVYSPILDFALHHPRSSHRQALEDAARDHSPHSTACHSVHHREHVRHRYRLPAFVSNFPDALHLDCRLRRAPARSTPKAGVSICRNASLASIIFGRAAWFACLCERRVGRPCKDSSLPRRFEHRLGPTVEVCEELSRRSCKGALLLGTSNKARWTSAITEFGVGSCLQAPAHGLEWIPFTSVPARSFQDSSW